MPTLSTIANLRGKGRFDEIAVRQILDSALENLTAYKGYVAPGSDAGAWQVCHGCETEEALLLQVCTEERLQAGIEEIIRKF